jgi:hypothetical protein
MRTSNRRKLAGLFDFMKLDIFFEKFHIYMLYNERKKSKKNSVKCPNPNMFLHKKTIYYFGFSFIEGMLFLIPVLPSSLKVRIIVVGFYYTAFLFHIPCKYWSWKKTVLNQFLKDTIKTSNSHLSTSSRLSISTSTTDLNKEEEDSDYYLL